MKLSTILLLLLTVCGISCGQILFKIGAQGLSEPEKIWRIFFSMPILAGIFIYGVSTLLWVYLLSGVELSKAYPFFAMSFILVPMLSWLWFGEPLDKFYFAGMLCILVGVILTTR
jgi:drug/metabolite transporter (DMT)-like permease